MKNYKANVEFIHCYFNCDNFKPKETALLLNAINGSRLVSDMRFEGYGMISFDEDSDSAHRYPEIIYANENGTPIESRRCPNCLVFNLISTVKNTEYDKLFLYHTNGKNGKGVWYGWVAYNTETGKYSHRFFVDHDTQDLLMAFNRFLNNINKVEHFRQHLAERRKNTSNQHK